MSDWLKKHGRKVLMAILAAVLAVSLTVTAVQRAQDRANAEANAEAAELAGLPPVRDQPAVESRDAKPGENDVPPDVAALLAVNLEALQAVNPDVMGWIEIPGTELSYPIVQGEDNRCYLDHNWKGSPTGAAPSSWRPPAAQISPGFIPLSTATGCGTAACSALSGTIGTSPTGRSTPMSILPQGAGCTATRFFPPMSRGYVT